VLSQAPAVLYLNLNPPAFLKAVDGRGRHDEHAALFLNRAIDLQESPLAHGSIRALPERRQAEKHNTFCWGWKTAIDVQSDGVHDAWYLRAMSLIRRMTASSILAPAGSC
jgi:hypothetical protein